MTEHVFITGISGCVGHYLFDALAGDPRYHLHLLVRDVSRLRFDYQDRPNVSIVAGDLMDIERHAELLGRMDHIIHVAAAWGEAVSYEVNHRIPFRMFELADPGRIKRLVYFATASVLDQDNRLLAPAEEHGTDYIRSKYQACAQLDAHPLGDRIVAVFPTLIFGGGARQPLSHLSSGLSDVGRWLSIARFLTLEGTLHFIHARDIARIVAHVLSHEVPERWLVLGNPELSVDQMIDQLCAAFGRRRPRLLRLDLTPMLGLIERLVGSGFNTWDRYSLKHRHFRYRTVNAETFGLPSDLSTLGAVVREQLAASR
ncbi:MAG TPA: NAD(P)-dependent oxidoreductase [Pantanalinema sp.]